MPGKASSEEPPSTGDAGGTSKDGTLMGNLLSANTSTTVGVYPHDMHPGLVPGLSIEEQRNTFGMNKVLFGSTAALIVAFIAWGILDPDSVGTVSSTMFGWAIENLGWLLNLVMILGLAVMTYLAFSRFGRIKLGKDDEEPEFALFSWVAMMFGAGIGVGIFFFGPSEPLSHYLTPPPHSVDREISSPRLRATSTLSRSAKATPSSMAWVMSARVVSIVMPKKTARALVSLMGLRSPIR